jgi:hypothetical protein
MGVSYSENMVLEWWYGRKLQWKYGTRMEVWVEITVAYSSFDLDRLLFK